MAKSRFIRVVFALALLTTLSAQNQRTTAKSNQVILKYLGTAGWEIGPSAAWHRFAAWLIS